MHVDARARLGYSRTGMRNRDCRPVSRFISETIQNTAIGTMEDK